MAAELDIVNLALVRLGQKTIASLSEGSVAARTASAIWDMTRQDVLRAFPWNFATRYLHKLALSGNYNNPPMPECSNQLPQTDIPVTPPNPNLPWPPDYTYAYQVPTDCLKAIKVRDPMEKFLGLDLWDDAWFDTYPAAILQGLFNENETSRFVVRENQTLFTDVPNAGLFYTYDVTTTSKFDPRFTSALAYRLAMDMAGSLTQSAQKVQSMMQLYQASLMAARTADAQEGKTRAVAGQSFLRSRV